MRCFPGGAMRASFAQNVQNRKVMFLNAQRSIEVNTPQMQRPRALSDETKGPNAPGNNSNLWQLYYTMTSKGHCLKWGRHEWNYGMDDRVSPQNHSLTSELSKPSAMSLMRAMSFAITICKAVRPWELFCIGSAPLGATLNGKYNFYGASIGLGIVSLCFLLFPVLAVFHAICSILEVKTVTWKVFAEMVFSSLRLV